MSSFDLGFSLMGIVGTFALLYGASWWVLLPATLVGFIFYIFGLREPKCVGEI